MPGSKTTRREWGTVRHRGTLYYATYRHGTALDNKTRQFVSVIHKAPISFQTEGAARVWLDSERQLIESGTWTSPIERERATKAEAMTLTEYANVWLEQATHLRPTTRNLYERQIRARIAPSALGDTPLPEIARADVGAWWRSLDHTHERTADIAYTVLRTILYGAVDDGLIEANPAQRIKGAGKPSKRRTIDPLTPAQVAAVADAMPPQWRLGVLLGAWCGLRSGEIRELRRKDINTATGVIKIRRGVTRASSEVVIGEPKTRASIRDVRIPASMLPDVRQHLLDFAQIGDEGLLFYEASGGKNVPDNRWRRAWLKACEQVGIEDFHFHDLRKTGLTYLALNGATARELQVIAGHTTATMAMRYQEVADDHLTGVYDRLSNQIGGTR